MNEIKVKSKYIYILYATWNGKKSGWLGIYETKEKAINAKRNWPHINSIVKREKREIKIPA